MSKIISIHSFRGGTGKSNTTANVSAQIAKKGFRVGVIDTDIQSPGIHVLFGMEEEEMKLALNDYLWGRCEIHECAYDVTDRVDSSMDGTIYLIPSSIKANEIATVLKNSYDVGLLNDGFQELIESLNLDALLIDTHPGLNEETLLSIAISDALAIILRPDAQDYQGTSVTVEIARRLGVPDLVLLVNKVPESIPFDRLQDQIEETYSTEVAEILPHSDEMMVLASQGIFSLRYPDHPLAERYRKLAERLGP